MYIGKVNRTACLLIKSGASGEVYVGVGDGSAGVGGRESGPCRGRVRSGRGPGVEGAAARDLVYSVRGVDSFHFFVKSLS